MSSTMRRASTASIAARERSVTPGPSLHPLVRLYARAGRHGGFFGHAGARADHGPGLDNGAVLEHSTRPHYRLLDHAVLPHPHIVEQHRALDSRVRADDAVGADDW